MSDDLVYRNTDDLQTDVQKIIEDAQKMAYQSVNVVLLQRNWLLGKRIAEEILHGENRAKYGAQVIKKLSKEFTRIFGRGFTRAIFIVFINFISCILRFSTQQVTNLRRF